MIPAPLSWNVSGQKVSLSALPLRNAHFLYAADIPAGSCPLHVSMEYAQTKQVPILLRGCDKILAERVQAAGGTALCLGSAAKIPLTDFTPSNSLRALSRRGGRRCVQIQVSPRSAAVLIKSLTSQRHTLPRLRYLYRSSPFRASAAFAALCSSSRIPLGIATTSTYAPGEAHLELLLRDYRAPIGTMELLLTGIIRHLRQHGFSTLNLGEVPFVGSREKTCFLTKRLLFAPLNYLLSPNFNTQGLYAFKDKFNPQWEPLYWVGYPRLHLGDFLLTAYKTRASALLKTPFPKLVRYTASPFFPLRDPLKILL